MEQYKQTSNAPGENYKALFACALTSTAGLNLGAQNSGAGSGPITVGEILLYVAIIIVVIAIAWVFASKQSSKSDNEHHAPTTKRYYDHPNDPHFKKLKKKTS